jgi:Zn-dependent peptidase ImmA (M78 family)
MTELTVVLKAREFVDVVNPTTIPVDVTTYANKLKAVIRLENDLGKDESGWSFKHCGKYYICVNAKDQKERQRFTVCHEIAHIVLGLPSDHNTLPSWSYSKKSPEEIFCDIFAAELLLPYRLFKPVADKEEISFSTVTNLANRFEASLSATGSRFATVISAPCAFVLSERGKVRYTSRSTSLREVNAWVYPRLGLPRGSVSERVRTGEFCNGPEEIDAYIWFSDWERGGMLLEEAVHLKQWDQTLTLLWFEDEEVPPLRRTGQTEKDDDWGVKELDGILPWPGKKRHK